MVVGSTTVMLTTTDCTPVAGTPPRPATVRSTVEPARNAPSGRPRPLRLSAMRLGVTVWYFPVGSAAVAEADGADRHPAATATAATTAALSFLTGMDFASPSKRRRPSDTPHSPGY